MVDRVLHALAAVALAAVAQLDRLVGAGAGAARDRGPAPGAREELDLDLDGRVAAGVEDLPPDDVLDGAHVHSCGKCATVVGQIRPQGPVVLRTSDVAFPGALDAAQLYQQSAAKAGITLEVKREPGDGYWSEVWNKQPFSMSYWTGRPTQDQVYSIAYLSKAEWNDTRFQRPDFDKLILDARKELDQAKRRELYRAAGVMLRDEGGVIVPMFNDYIDATNDKVGGWVDNPNSELMGGHALTKCWVVA